MAKIMRELIPILLTAAVPELRSKSDDLVCLKEGVATV